MAAFRPEFHDKGHRDMIDKLLRMSECVTELLVQKFQVKEPEDILEISDADVIVSDSADGVDGSINTDVSCKPVIREFFHNKKLLQEELQKYMDERMVMIDMIFIKLESLRARLQEHVTSPLSLADPEFALIERIPGLYKMKRRALELSQMGKSTRDGLQLIGTVNWNHVSSLRDLVEFIYQDQVQLMTLSVSDDIILNLAFLINGIRKKENEKDDGKMLTYHYEIENGEGIFVLGLIDSKSKLQRAFNNRP